MPDAHFLAREADFLVVGLGDAGYTLRVEEAIVNGFMSLDHRVRCVLVVVQGTDQDMVLHYHRINALSMLVPPVGSALNLIHFLDDQVRVLERRTLALHSLDWRLRGCHFTRQELFRCRSSSAS